MSGRCYRVFAAVDEFTRESVAMEAAGSLPAAKVTEVLDRAIVQRGRRPRIVCDNGSEFTSLWFRQRGRAFALASKPLKSFD